MSRIEGCCFTATNSWAQQKYEHIKNHVAWKDDLSEDQAKELLEGKPPFSYLLRRNGTTEHAYFISFVKSDGTLKHQWFVLEVGRKGWFYRNGVAEKPVEVLADTLEEIIPMMMHCKSDECKPLGSIAQF